MQNTDSQLKLQELPDRIDLERRGPLARVLSAVIFNPLANYLPAGLLKAVLRAGKSELAEANWTDPGGWRSMVISYEATPRQVADKALISAGTMSKALRNRRRLAREVLARLIDASETPQPHVLCLGAGPGYIIADAMLRASRQATATLVDVSDGAFAYGRKHAERLGLADRMHFVLGDARDIHQVLDRPPDIVQMLGLCEYLTDEQILGILTAVSAEMPPEAPIVTNSLSRAHGTDRFFRRVFGLHMKHRRGEEIRSLLHSSGFCDFTSLPEPLGVYDVIVGRRGAREPLPADGS